MSYTISTGSFVSNEHLVGETSYEKAVDLTQRINNAAQLDGSDFPYANITGGGVSIGFGEHFKEIDSEKAGYVAMAVLRDLELIDDLTDGPTVLMSFQMHRFEEGRTNGQ